MEIDDPAAAAMEIMNRLDLGGLLKNSVGIMVCHLEFMESGSVEEICSLLPFDVAGINTLCSATSAAAGQEMLAIAVLTSDDVSFAAGVSDSLADSQREKLADLYARTSSRLPDVSKLMLTFAPLMDAISGDKIVEFLNETSGGIPAFGTLPSDFSTVFRDPRVICNGQTYNDRVAIIVMGGNINPTFNISMLTSDKMLERKAIVTNVEGPILKEVNGRPSIEYFESIGVARNGQIDNAHIIFPITIDCNDGAPPITRSILKQLPNGDVVLGGSAPLNSTLGVGGIDSEDVLDSAGKIVRQCTHGEGSFAFFVSCIVRNFVLGLDDMAEIERVQSVAGGGIPWLFVYSGGEICPVRSSDGQLINRFHNMTLVSCVI
jgi:hypothetical protein